MCVSNPWLGHLKIYESLVRVTWDINWTLWEPKLRVLLLFKIGGKVLIPRDILCWSWVQTTCDMRHEKIDLKVFVVVIPKEGWTLLTSSTIFSKSRCHTKRRMDAATRAHPSFGMTTTNTLKSVFSWHVSYRTWEDLLQQLWFCHSHEY